MPPPRKGWYNDPDLVEKVREKWAQSPDLPQLLAFLGENGHDITPMYLRNTLGHMGIRVPQSERRKQAESRRPLIPVEAGQSHEEAVEAAIRQRQSDDARSHHDKLLKEKLDSAAKWQTLMDTLRETDAAIPLRKIPAAPGAPSNRGKGAERICAFAFSDIQAGIANHADEVGARFEYNSTMLADRFAVYEREVWKWIDEQRLIGPVVGIEFFGVGDWIENHKLHPGSAKRTDLTNTRATIVLCRLITEFVVRLLARYPGIPIDWEIIPGNHDRMGVKQGDELCFENWAVIIGEMLRLKFERQTRVTIHIYQQEYALLQIGQTRVMLHHGHGIQGTALLPWYGIDRRVGRWEGFHRQQFDMVVIGHFHNPAMWQTTSGAKVYVNGSWFDSTAYGASLGLATPAQQFAFAITEEGGCVNSREMYLTGKIISTPTEPRGWGDKAA